MDTSPPTIHGLWLVYWGTQDIPLTKPGLLGGGLWACRFRICPLSGFKHPSGQYLPMVINHLSDMLDRPFNSLPEFLDFICLGRTVSVANYKFGPFSWPIHSNGSELNKALVGSGLACNLCWTL